MKRTRWILGFGLVFTACGEAPDLAFDISFQRHALDCDVPGLLVLLEAQQAGEPEKIPGDCRAPDLVVNDEQSVSGRCAGVPTGKLVNFRLEYFIFVAERNQELGLASVATALDLTSPSEDVVTLDFTQAPLVTAPFEEDNDGVPNLEEICTGRDPFNRDG